MAGQPMGTQREPDDEYHVIDGAGHCANLDRPERANTLITSFLARRLNHGAVAG